jgi:Ca2+-binding RTX toxin-like protein
MPTQFFTDGNDSFTVTAAGDYSLVFLDGNDTLTVNGGTFTTGVMGEGADVITLKAGDALIYGDGGNDRFEIYAGGFEARGGADDDTFNLRGGNNLTLRGDGGNDRFNFIAGSLNVLLSAGDGDDYLNGNGKVVSGTIYGNAGNDIFVGFRDAGGTVPTLRGGTGDDLYRADAAAPATFVENAGQGTDTVQVSQGASYTLGANIENLTVGPYDGGTSGAATLTGNVLNNLISGYGNAETINGGQGNDTLYGNSGADVLNGQLGDDTLYGGNGIDTLNGGIGSDVLDGGAGADQLIGGIGNDIYYTDGGDVITELSGEGLDLVRVMFAYTLSDNVENGTIISDGGFLAGNALNNLLTGSAGNDFIRGSGGNDTINGGAGDDANLWGDEGNDRIDGGSGVDTMLGGLGDDRYFVDNLSDEVRENPGEGTDTIVLNAPDQLNLNAYHMPDDVENIVNSTTHPKNVYGNDLANLMTGSAIRDELNGMAGDDTLIGLGGGDDLFGFDGADTINGGSGDDRVCGDGNGTITYAGDTLTGGAGADNFFYLTVEDSAPFILRVDQITDFETGVDTLYLGSVDANANVAASQDWTVVASPSHTAGELWIDDSGAASGDFVLFGDDDGDGLADLMIRIHAPGGFVATDIFL